MPKSILIVEDSVTDVDLVREAFAEIKGSFHLDVASNGEEAVSFIHSDIHYDLVLLDLNMPCMSGIEFLKEVRRQRCPKGLIPVIILTNSHSDEDVCSAYSFGANAYIRKPLGIDALIEHLNNLSKFWFDTATTTVTRRPL